MNDLTKELLFGIVWALVTVIILCGLGLDFEQPDYFIGVVR